MADTIEIVVTAVDSFSSVLGNFGNILTGLKSTVDMVAGAIEGVWDFTSQFVDAAAESEVAVTKLNTVLASTGGTMGLTSDQLQQMATDMQNLSGFSDEAEMSAEAMLLRYENLNEDIFPTALQLTNDLAVSLGVDLTSAARMIGMALDDPTQGIGRLNTQFRLFDDTEMENIKTMAEHGNVMEAQMLIIERLREKVGGAAQAYGETFAGSLAIAKEKLDNMKETIGGAILPILGDLLDKVVKFAETDPTIQAVLGFFQKFADLQNMPGDIPVLSALGAALLDLDKVSPVFHDIGEALLVFQGALTLGATPLEAFNKAMDELPSSWAPAITAIQNFIETGQSEGWGAAISQLFGDIVTSLDLNAKIQGALDSLSNAIILWTQSGGADSLIKTLSGVLGDVIKGTFDVLDETIGQVDFAPILTALANALWAGLKSAVSGIGNAFWDWFATDVFGDASQETFWAGVKDGFSHFGDFLLGVIFPPSLIWTARQWWGGLAADIWEGFLDGLSAIGLGGMADWIQTHIIDPVKEILGISSPSTVFYDIGTALIQGLISGVSSMWNAITSLFDDLLDAILAPFQPVLDLLGINLGGGTSSTTGSVGGRDMGGGTTTTPTSTSGGGGVVNNFYGPVYFGDMQQLGYDCPSPNPLVAASQGSLLVSPSIG